MQKALNYTTFVAVGVAVLGIALAPAPAQAQGTLFVQGDQVLIGDNTAVPGAKLAVTAASIGAVDAIFLQNTSGPARLNLQNLAQSETATTSQKWTINSNGDLRFTAGVDGPEMRIDAGGTLTVQTAIKVGATTLNVPDYVFEPDYGLMPLNELKSYVTANRHLPEIPSANDVSEQGLDMTAMQMKILQKVEELTLYTLQQHETIEALQAKIDSLEQEIR